MPKAKPAKPPNKGSASENSTRQNRDAMLHGHLVELLRGNSAHAEPAAVLQNVPPECRAIVPKRFPHTAWQLLEHLRLAQHDILDFCQNSNYTAPKFPDDYWPAGNAPPSDDAWDKSLTSFLADLRAMEQLVSDRDLYAKIPWGEGQTLLREALLVADHNSYHLGQFVALRRQLGDWKG